MIPKVSIIVPVYNTAPFLDQCLFSLINQTLDDIEIILVNDGSTDNSLEICLKYAENDSRVQVVDKENGGLSDARNYGLKYANAEYIGFVDSDDYVDLDMYEKMYVRSNESKAEIIVCGIKHFRNENEVYLVRKVNENVTLNRQDSLKELFISKRITNSVCNKIFKKSLFKDIYFPKGKLYEDEFVTYKLFQKANKVCILNDTYYYYRMNNNSITHKPFSEKEFDRVEASLAKIDFCKMYYPDLIQYVQQYLVYDCISALSKMKNYKKEYNDIIKSNIRENIFVYWKGNNSIFSKIFATFAAASPQIALKMYKIIN